MTEAMTDRAQTAAAERLRGWDHIELWVGNARTTAQFFSSALGFTITAYAGPETGTPDQASYLLEQGSIRVVVTAGLSAMSPITAHVQHHGDGVRDLSWTVDDVDAAFASAIARGARPVSLPAETSDDDGVVRTATVATYGETVHSFVDRSGHQGIFGPGFVAEGMPRVPPGPPVGLERIDHTVGNVELGSLDRWVDFYESVLGFSELLHYDDDQIRTEYSALMSTVVWNGESIVLPLNEPAEGRRRSQIQEYLDTYDGPGVQHLAFATEDIVATVHALRARGVRFLETPPAYYDDVRDRLAHLRLPWDTLAGLGILVDEDQDGYLLQIFTENITDRPTLFLEIIQRAGANGFGEGNFKALFEAIERQQDPAREPLTMPFYRRVGQVPAKRHVRVTSSDGGWLAEELMGTSGFAGGSSLLYHRHSPSAIDAAEPMIDDRPACTPDHPLLPRHLRTAEVAVGGDPVRDRHVLLANQDVTIAVAHADRSSGLFRNAVGDELVFVHDGSAVLETSFGPLAVGPGDYVVVPMSTVHRWRLTSRRLDLLVLEATGHVVPPRRYLTDDGQFREGSPYCERDLHGPEELPEAEPGPVEIVVRNRGGLTSYCQSHHPFDVVGWDGTVYPYRFSIHDFEPIVGAVHQPPPVHQTFEGPGFAVCSFVPRPFDFGAGAAKVPYHHANVDCDEVLFYTAGDFMSRAGSGIGVGSISLHPAGFVHGPQPGSVEAAVDQERTEEVAVMVDTFRPLEVSDLARDISAADYPWTWSGRA